MEEIAYKYFKPSEFRCKCGCGFYIQRSKLLTMLDNAREYCVVNNHNFPWIITSGSRCESWNSKQGGDPKSSHFTGWAVDIATHNSTEKFWVRKALLMAGFTRFGIGSNYIHADIDPNKPKEVEWWYPS